MEVSISILGLDFNHLDSELKRIEKSKADSIHFDIMDGQFVQNKSFSPEIFETVSKKTSLPLDIHLMVFNPEVVYLEYVQKFKPRTVGFHFEALYYPEIKKLIRDIQGAGEMNAAIVLNPETDVDQIFEYTEYVDEILLMSVHPGKGGQQFIETTLDKIKKLDEYRKLKNFNFKIAVDGGINTTNSKLCKKLGADKVICGSFALNSSNMENVVKDLRR